MSKFWSGRPKTAEQLEKMAATKRGKPLTAEHRLKVGAMLRRAYEEGRRSKDRPQEMRDKIGRGVAKLTDDQVAEIRLKKRHGATQAALGNEYGLSSSAISNICTRKTYAWVP